MDKEELEALSATLAAEIDLTAVFAWDLGEILAGFTWDFDEILAGFNWDLCEVMAEFC